MSKPRICKSCHWLQNRAEPCWSCSRWGKGKTDHYIPAEETLGEYLQRKEREEMEKENIFEMLGTAELIESYKLCMNDDCEECPGRLEDDCASQLSEAIIKRLKQLQQELIDERDRYDRLVSFELDEAELLRAAKGEGAVNVSPVGRPSSVPTKTQNVVLVQFCKGSKKYLYALPKRSKVRKGMELTVNTGDIYHACCDSFLVGGAALDALVELAGAKLPLTFVSGVVLKLAPDE